MVKNNYKERRRRSTPQITYKNMKKLQEIHSMMELTVKPSQCSFLNKS